MAGAWIAAVAAAEHVAAGAREGIFACSHGDGGPLRPSRATASPIAPREGSRPARHPGFRGVG